MVDIQSATAEIRRGKNIELEWAALLNTGGALCSTTLRLGEEKKTERIETTGQKYNVRICYAGRP